MAWISEAQKHYEEYVDYYTSLLEDYVDDHILELAPAYGQLQEAAVGTPLLIVRRLPIVQQTPTTVKEIPMIWIMIHL